MFSKTRLMEIVSKDMAYEFIVKHHPVLENVAQKYCFRARMNVLRGVYREHVEESYSETVRTCEQYVYRNYPLIRKELRLKERIEFVLLRFFKSLYVVLNKLYAL